MPGKSFPAKTGAALSASRSLIRHDRARLSSASGGLIGVDEAGRGALAGPVVAAVFFAPPALLRRMPRALWPVCDSKRLSPALRSELATDLFQLRRQGRADFALGSADAMEIDALNILGATRLAMERAMRSLLRRHPGLECMAPDRAQLSLFNGDASAGPEPIPVCLLVDGLPLRPFPWLHEALVQGDNRSWVIAAASILAKTVRDRWMAHLSLRHPGYCWETSRGYGTVAHRQSIARLGLSPLHRRSFLSSDAALLPHSRQAMLKT